MGGSHAYWRLDESLQQVRRLRENIDRWFASWKLADKDRAHASQLEAIQTTTNNVLELIAAKLSSIEPGDELGSVYDRCRSHDMRTAHIHRLWRFFADKFDQRFDRRMAPALAAADEVGWSCYAAAAGQPGWTPAAPLAYFDARYAPSAFTREDTPVDLRPADELLRKHVRLLPIPLVALPPVCADRPWWLVLMAHEMGHQVQNVVGGQKFIEPFADIVASAAANQGMAGDAWRGWSQEMFADAFAVLTAGEWAAWAVAEMERTTPGEMRVSADDRYPPPLVRASFMAGIAAAAGWSQRPAGLADEDGDETARLAPAVAAAVADAPLGGAGCPTLLGLAGLSGAVDRAATVARWQRTIGRWRRTLAGDDPLVADTTHVEAARLCVAGAAAAWHDLLGSEGLTQQQIEHLRDRSLDIVSRCHAAGTRDAGSSAQSLTEMSGALASSLFAAGPDELGVG